MAIRLFIEDKADHKHIARDVRIYVVDDDGVETDISSIVRNIDVKLHMGEIVTANLEVMITGFESRCIAEDVVLRHLPKRRFWNRWRRPFNVSGFDRLGRNWYAR